MAVITVDILVNSLEDVLEFFDRIEVHRSITVENGTYVELTDLEGPTAAIIDGSEDGSFNLNGLTLDILLDGEATAESVLFEGTDPIDLATIIEQINEVVPTLASEVPSSTNRLRLTSVMEGTISSITITAGAAATVLGLSSTKVNGKERRITIIDPTTMYQLFDKDGLNEYWYKTRFSNSESVLVSEFSIPHQGGVDSAVPVSQLVKGTIYLVNGLGLPIIGNRLIFIPMIRGVVASTSYNVIPGFYSRAEVLTNGAGYAEANLIRGITYRMILEGTSLVREFVAPLLGDTFDLMTVTGTTPDPYDIAQTPPRPIKMS